MNPNNYLSEKETAVEARQRLTDTLVDAGQILIDLENLVEVLSDKLHGTNAEPQNLLPTSAPGILEIADKNYRTIVSIYTRLHDLVAQL